MFDVEKGDIECVKGPSGDVPVYLIGVMPLHCLTVRAGRGRRSRLRVLRHKSGVCGGRARRCADGPSPPALGPGQEREWLTANWASLSRCCSCTSPLHQPLEQIQQYFGTQARPPGDAQR